MEEVRKIWLLEETLEKKIDFVNSLDELEQLEAEKTELHKKKMDFVFEKLKLSEDQEIYVAKRRELKKRREQKYPPYENSVASRTRNNAGHRKMSDKICVYFKKVHYTDICAL
jgi:hypothetical protein